MTTTAPATPRNPYKPLDGSPAATLAAEINKLTAEQRDVQREKRKLRSDHNEAAAQDTADRAAAHRAGKPDPGTKHTDKVEKAFKEADTREDIITAALGQARLDLRACLRSDEFTAWAHALYDSVGATRDQLIAELDQVAAKAHGLDSALKDAKWVEHAMKNAEEGKPGMPSAVGVQLGVTLNGVRMKATDALGVLMATVDQGRAGDPQP